MIHYIPYNLDIDDHLLNYPPVKIKRFKKAHLTYILSLVSEVPANNKHLREFNGGFIPMNAQRLQNKIHNYNQYLQYLVDTGILEVNKQYFVGRRSRSYRFTDMYSVFIKPITINKSIKIPNTETINQIQNNKLIKYHYLVAWFNHKLKINSSEAYDFIRRFETDGLQKFSKRKLIGKVNSSIVNINRIENRDFRLSIDNNVHRFHSNLTNLKSELRNFLTYDCKKLVSTDISNSQPYLSTILLSEKFYSVEHSVGYSDSLNFESFLHQLNYGRLFNKGKCLLPKNIRYIQRLLGNQRTNYGDIESYIRLVSNGTFYEFLQTIFSKKLGKRYANRKEVKNAIFAILFSSNRFIGQKEAKPKKIFRDHFPTVYKVFAEIKKNDHTLLPRLLQLIESSLVLDRICKRISIEKSWLPIFTIHDSIATTVGAENYIFQIMTNELSMAIGIQPSLKIEYWDPEQLIDLYLSSSPRLINWHTNIIG